MYYKRIICDIDDTISITKNRNWDNAKPIQEVINKINYLYELGWEIWLFTARGNLSCGSHKEADNKYRKQIENWLNFHNVKYHKLSFEKYLATYYIDDKNLTPSQFVNLDIKTFDKGWSGADVELRDGKVYKTHKDSLSVVEWYDIALKFFDVPEIYSLIGNTICMEYIQQNNKLKLDPIIDLFFKFKKVEVNDCSFDTYIKRISDHCDFNNDFHWSLSKLSKISDFCDKNKSFCHGDLTIENIIPRNGKFYLIDPIFDKNCYSSYLLDISKFLHSLKKNKMFIEYKYVINSIKHEIPLEVLNTLELSQWVRVYKYAPDNMKQFIKNEIECFKN